MFSIENRRYKNNTLYCKRYDSKKIMKLKKRFFKRQRKVFNIKIMECDRPQAYFHDKNIPARN